MEIWKPIGSIPDFEASSCGRVRLSVERKNSRWGVGRGKYGEGFIYKPRIRLINGIAYAILRLLITGRRRQRMVHRLVCEAFHGPPPSAIHHAAHKNGRSLDNRPRNVYWATAAQNIADRERHGRTARGERIGTAKLRNRDIPRIRRMLADGETQIAIGARFGVSNYCICDINRGRSWTSLKTIA